MRKAQTVERPQIWREFRVRWQFLTRVCGQTPADPEIVRKWLEARQPNVRPPGGKSIDDINNEVLDSIASGDSEPPEFSVLTFQKHNGGLVFRAGTIKAHIKDCARVISAQYVGKIKGERSFAVRVVNGVYVDEAQYWVPLLRQDGTPVVAADGMHDKPVHVMTRQGQINALKRFEYVAPPCVMDFTIKVLGQSVTEDDLHYLFTYGGTHGYAGERGDGEGRYHYDLEAVSPQ